MTKGNKTSPLFLLFQLLAVVFLAETGVAFLLHAFALKLPVFKAVIVNSALLVGAAGPVLFILIFQPLGDEMERRRQAVQALSERDEQLKASDHHLDAAKHQLQANKQQLQVADQKLAANEQQLNAVQQQLRASEERLSAVDQQRQASEAALRAAQDGLEEKVKARTKELEKSLASLEAKVEKKTRELQGKMKEVDKMSNLTGEREGRVIELKREVNKLARELGRPEPYLGGAS